jgi:hypothetical protein
MERYRPKLALRLVFNFFICPSEFTEPFYIFLPVYVSLSWLNNVSCSFLSYLLPVRLCSSNLGLPASFVHCTVKQVNTVGYFKGCIAVPDSL